MAWFTTKEKAFIAYAYNELKLRPREVTEAFNERFDRMISTPSVHKYKSYSYNAGDFKNSEKPEIKLQDIENPKGNPKGVSRKYVDSEIAKVHVRIESLYDMLETWENGSDNFKITKDGTKDHIIDFSSGEISKEDLEKIAKIRGTDEKESFEFLKKCYKKGLFIINLETQEIDGVELEKEDKDRE